MEGIKVEPLQSQKGFQFFEVFDESKLNASSTGFGEYIGMVGFCLATDRWIATFNMTSSNPDDFTLDTQEDAVSELRHRNSG
jgi:hypothetical protein